MLDSSELSADGADAELQGEWVDALKDVYDWHFGVTFTGIELLELWLEID